MLDVLAGLFAGTPLVQFVHHFSDTYGAASGASLCWNLSEMKEDAASADDNALLM